MLAEKHLGGRTDALIAGAATDVPAEEIVDFVCVGLAISSERCRQ
jgi:hypothetical protein